MRFNTNKGFNMRRFWPLIIFAIILVIATLSNQNKPQPLSQHSPQRIISLSPSITETLFAVGAGANVVGVTKYCDFPAATQSIAKVGGFVDPNIEAIVALKPDLVILLAAHSRAISQLTQLKIPVLAVKNTTLDDIKNTITTIGDKTGHQAKASLIISHMEQRIQYIADKTEGRPTPSVMIAMGHSIGTEHIKQSYIAGNQDFYNDIIQLAGGVNAYQGADLKVPSVAIEGIMDMNPQVIIDVFPEADDHNSDLNRVLRAWKNIKYVDAVKNDRIYIIEENYATIPGPRIILLLEQIARLLHPELNWDSSPS